MRPALRDQSRHALCRPLRSVLGEYLSMVESEERKRRLVSANPLAKHIYNVLEEQEILQSMQQHRHGHQGVVHQDRELASSVAPASVPAPAALPGGLGSPLVSPGTIRSSIYGQQMRAPGHATPSRNLFGGGGPAAVNGAGAGGGSSRNGGAMVIEQTPSPQRNGRKKSTPRKRKQTGPAHRDRDRLAERLAERINAGREDGNQIPSFDDVSFNDVSQTGTARLRSPPSIDLLLQHSHSN